MSGSALAAFTIQFNRYAPIPTFILGFFGNIFNICTFTQPSLIKNPCSIYFISASVANLLVLLFGLIVRSLVDGFGIDLISHSLAFCRIRYFMLHCSMSLSSWFTILAGIDRYCISSRHARRRQISNRRFACRSVAVATGLGVVLYSHVFGLFTIEQLKSGPYCYAQTGTYRIFYDFLYFACYSFTPPLLMIVVGLGTVNNIHRMRQQVHSTDGGCRVRKRDRQLIRMLLIQIVCTVILTLPIAVQKLYAVFTQQAVKGALQTAVENFITQVLRNFSFIECSSSFYV